MTSNPAAPGRDRAGGFRRPVDARGSPRLRRIHGLGPKGERGQGAVTVRRRRTNGMRPRRRLTPRVRKASQPDGQHRDALRRGHRPESCLGPGRAGRPTDSPRRRSRQTANPREQAGGLNSDAVFLLLPRTTDLDTAHGPSLFCLGQLLANLSTMAKSFTAKAIWDVEDEELLEAARSHLEELSAPHAPASQSGSRLACAARPIRARKRQRVHPRSAFPERPPPERRGSTSGPRCAASGTRRPSTTFNCRPSWASGILAEWELSPVLPANNLGPRLSVSPRWERSSRRHGAARTILLKHLDQSIPVTGRTGSTSAPPRGRCNVAFP